MRKKSSKLLNPVKRKVSIPQPVSWMYNCVMLSMIWDFMQVFISKYCQIEIDEKIRLCYHKWKILKMEKFFLCGFSCRYFNTRDILRIWDFLKLRIASYHPILQFARKYIVLFNRKRLEKNGHKSNICWRRIYAETPKVWEVYQTHGKVMVDILYFKCNIFMAQIEWSQT